jgi:pimeloyl-ACP methyl ester carboxylesterase
MEQPQFFLIMPARYLVGKDDTAFTAPGMAECIANPWQVVPTLKGVQMVDGCGHWTRQERPSEVSAAIIDFLRSLPG